ncbi:MAG: Spy/CpxP family protein refolding chaperone [Parvibaculum sp.]|uniref:Spy/CpxP family protein refolding chaperone n=1 Tax=Parvibaculum sp. TaxID=2024848 RepID=UPI003C7109D1
MKLRLAALITLLALFCIPIAIAQEASPQQQGNRPGMMGQGRGPGPGWGQGWGPGMMGGWGPGMMGGWGRGMMGYGYGGGRGWGPGMMGGCGMYGYRAGSDGADIDSYVEGRLAFLKAELKITDAQGAAWNAYADAQRANAQVMASMHKQMFEALRSNDRSAVNFFDLHIRMMKSRLAALEALKPATEGLYKVLSAEQKQRADDLLPFMGCL